MEKRNEYPIVIKEVGKIGETIKEYIGTYEDLEKLEATGKYNIEIDWCGMKDYPNYAYYEEKKEYTKHFNGYDFTVTNENGKEIKKDFGYIKHCTTVKMHEGFIMTVYKIKTGNTIEYKGILDKGCIRRHTHKTDGLNSLLIEAIEIISNIQE